MNDTQTTGPVGIGPVIAGRDDTGQPAYYVDLAYADGSTNRRFYPKRSAGADRLAKFEAFRERIQIANTLRSRGVMLLHDQHSFDGLLALLRGEITQAPLAA